MFDAVVDHLRDFSLEFSRRGKEVYLVGGAVRNLLLGRPAQDYDFATDALPSEVQSFFRRVLPTGLQHGTVTVLFRGESFEVTTFRIDGTYSDGRRPDGVAFSTNLEEDLARRDFTINAMALNLSDGSLVDPFGGQDDLRRGLLRAIGNPGHRFDEDALRILRLFRFAAQLGFSMDSATLDAVPSRIRNLASVSRERVREELWKAMAGGEPQLAFGPLGKLGILTDLFAPMSIQPGTYLNRLSSLSADIRWSYWLTLAGPSYRDQWERILRALTWSNAQVASTLGPTKALGFLASDLGLSNRAKSILEAWGNRDRAAIGMEYLGALEAEGYWEDTKGLKAELLRVAKSAEPIFLGELDLNGDDLMRWGLPPGPQIGKVLRNLQKRVWEDPSLNSKERLKALAMSPS